MTKNKNFDIAVRNIIGRRISHLRRVNNLSLSFVATLLGKTYQMISKYENGETTISITSLYLLSQYYNIKIDTILPSQNDIEIEIELLK